MRRLIVILAVLGLSGVASAQTTQPMVQLADITYVGSFTVPADDGTGTPLTYGGRALSMGADGQSLYFGAIYTGCVARISIPAIGGSSTLLERCNAASIPNLGAINPGDPNSKLIGGVLAWQGQLVASGYSSYDGAGTAVASHWRGATLPTATGPVRVGTLNPGFVAGYMGVIPQEWRAAMGYPAFTGQCCISIISRTSLGPTLSGFDPSQIGVTSPVPSTMLVGYPIANPTLGDYANYPSPFTNGYGIGTRMGGVAWIGRTVAFIGTRGGTSCYGPGTTNPALHGQTTTGGVWCYDPMDANKGGHGYPYDRYVWLYDANDLAAVKAGTKQPWQVVPYARGNLPSSSPTDQVEGATYDPATRRIYLTLATAGAQPRVHVYQVSGTVTPLPPPPPPPPVNCVGVWAESLSAPTPLACDATQVQTRTRTRTFTVTTPASNGGTCVEQSQSPVVTTETSACVFVPPPPPPLPQFSARFRSQSLVTAGLRVTFQVAAAQTVPAIGATVQVLVDGTPVTGTVFDVDASYYSGTPRDTRVIVTLPGLTYLAYTVRVP
jgi:hypothetical protein